MPDASRGVKHISKAPRPVRVALIEDEVLTRSLLEERIRSDKALELVCSFSGAQEALLALRPGMADAAVIDIQLIDGNGVQLGHALQRKDPRLAILLLSAQNALVQFTAAQTEASRPWSYLSKRSAFSRSVLLDAIVGASRGEVIVDPVLLSRAEPRTGSPVAELTPTQFLVLRLVAEGLSNRAIAERLTISDRSVESHLLTIYKRLGLQGDDINRRVAAAIRFAEQTGRVWPS